MKKSKNKKAATIQYNVMLDKKGNTIDIDEVDRRLNKMQADLNKFIQNESDAAEKHRAKDIERLADGARHMQAVERFLAAIEKALSK